MTVVESIRFLTINSRRFYKGLGVIDIPSVSPSKGGARYYIDTNGSVKKFDETDLSLNEQAER